MLDQLEGKDSQIASVENQLKNREDTLHANQADLN